MCVLFVGHFFLVFDVFLVIDLEQEFVIESVSTAIVEIIAIIIIKKNPLFNHDFHESTKTRSSFHVFCCSVGK